MSVYLTAFASEMLKVAEAEKEQKVNYPRAVVAGLPVVLAQAVSDIPEGVVERSVETTLRNGKPVFKVDLGALRFASRLGAGALTTPLFLSGLRDLKEAKSKKDQQRGMAKLVGAGAAYSGLRGSIEASFDSGMSHKPIKEKLLRVAGPKTALGIGAAVATGYTVGRGLQKETKDPTVTEKYLKPAAVGSALAGGKGVIEEIGLEGTKALTPRGIRGVAARAGGKATAGAFATLAMSEIMRRALGKEKKAEVGPVGEPTPTSHGLHLQTVEWAKAAPTEQLTAVYRELGVRGGERSPSSRAVFYAVHDELSARGVQLPPLGLRDQVTGLVPSPKKADLALLVGVSAAPTLAWHVLNSLPPTDRDRVLTDALDRMYLQGKIRVFHETAEGKPVSPGQGASYPQARAVQISPDADPAELAHEIGHVRRSGMRAATIGSEQALQVAAVGRFMSVAMPVLAVGSSIDSSFSTSAELEAKANLLTALGSVTGMMQAPHLAEEAVANLKAIRYLSEAGAAKEELVAKTLKSLSPSFASYLTAAALPFVGASILRRRARAKSEKRK